MKKLARNIFAAIGIGLLAGLLLAPRAGAQTPTTQACTLLPSAVRTTTAAVNSTDRANTGAWAGVTVVLDISTYTAGTFTPTIQGKDPLSGKYYTILAGTGRATSTGSPFIMKVFPGAAAGSDVANDQLPGTWRISVLGSGGPNAQYSVSCWLLSR